MSYSDISNSPSPVYLDMSYDDYVMRESVPMEDLSHEEELQEILREKECESEFPDFPEDEDFALPPQFDLDQANIHARWVSEKNTKVPQSTFRIQSNQLFLTYPHCPLDKQSAFDQLQYRLNNDGQAVDQYIVAEETHQNGLPHLHVYFQISSPNSKFRTSNVSYFDLLVSDTWYHGNYQGCRSSKNVMKYCTKKDNFISNFDVAEKLGAAVSHRKFIGQQLLTKPLHELIPEFPELLFNYDTLSKNLKTYHLDITPNPPEVPSFIPNDWGVLMPFDHSLKRRHYWIWSRLPNRGKTTFGRKLCKELMASFVGGERGFFDVNPTTRILIFDEFTTARFFATVLNQMCDGNYKYPYFGRGNIALQTSAPLIIILSNRPISQVYPNAQDVIRARFIEMHIDGTPTFDCPNDCNCV